MKVYYNEWDDQTAAWLRELGSGHHLPSGYVDTRSIRDVRAAEVCGYDQCHFFAGIGGWPLALRWAGLEDVPGIWTGSPPCQPFSVAGKGLAQSDERHLAPVWLGLIKECPPAMLFGEQVADAIGKGWLDDLFDALEREGYACGAAVLPACSVGAPHIRKRLFFGAVRVADADKIKRGRRPDRKECQSDRATPRRVKGNGIPKSDMPVDRLAHTNEDGLKPGRGVRSVCAEHDAEHGSAARGMANADDARPQGWAGMSECPDEQFAWAGSLEGRSAHPDNGFWSGADWLGCRDGKFRPVEPGSQPLAHGLPARVGRLRGYGNAIVPQVAATFIEEFMNAISETLN